MYLFIVNALLEFYCYNYRDFWLLLDGKQNLLCYRLNGVWYFWYFFAKYLVDYYHIWCYVGFSGFWRTLANFRELEDLVLFFVGKTLTLFVFCVLDENLPGKKPLAFQAIKKINTMPDTYIGKIDFFRQSFDNACSTWVPNLKQKFKDKVTNAPEQMYTI